MWFPRGIVIISILVKVKGIWINAFKEGSFGVFRSHVGTVDHTGNTTSFCAGKVKLPFSSLLTLLLSFP